MIKIFQEKTSKKHTTFTSTTTKRTTPKAMNRRKEGKAKVKKKGRCNSA